jgi:predicted ribosomally synthesized peptide with SipW-like signal peptide
MADDNDDTFSRRTILGGIATLGAAGAVAGSGTMAIFSDTEEATIDAGAGTLDLTVDGGDATVHLIEESGLQPGDSGTTSLSVRNAGTLEGILTVEATAYTNTEGSPSEWNDGGDGELGEHLLVDVQSLTGGYVTLDEFVANHLPYTRHLTGGAGGTLSLDWKLPLDTGNAVQGDGVSLDVTLDLVQADNVVTGTTAADWPQVEYDGVAFGAKARYGDGSAGTAAAANAELSVAGSQDGGYDWTEGEAEPFTFEYDAAAGEATLTVDGSSTSGQVGSVSDGVLAITAKGYDGKTTEVTDLVLDGQALVPGTLTATDGIASFQTDADAFDVASGFTLTGTLTFDDVAGNGPSSEDPAVQFGVN